MSAAASYKPYVGLRPFQTDDAAWFFGRDRESAALASKIRGNRFTGVVGASGSGKSSLVLAGVLPQLVADGWQSLYTKPGAAPIAQLAAALAAAAVRSEDHFSQARRFHFDASLRGSAFGLADVVASMAPNASHIVLVVDQFEELFRYGEGMAGSQRAAMREEGRAFVELLLTATRREASRLHVVLTMRSSYFGNCAAYQGLAEAVSASLHLVSFPSRDQLETAIRSPVAKAGATIDDGLVQRLLVEVEEEADRLPLLQHCLMRLWQQASVIERPEGSSESCEVSEPRRVLDLATYPGLRESLSGHADEILTELERQNSDYPRVAEFLFRALTEIDNQGRAIRRPRTMTELTMETGVDPAVLQRVIGPFRRDDATFLAPYGDKPLTDDDVVDISHEALIHGWQRIADPESGWLQREFQDGLIWRSLLAPAERFEKNRKDVLSPALTEDRRVWLKGRPPAWCERYGGGWQAVNNLIKESVDAATRARRRDARLLALAGVLVIALLFVVEGVYWTMKRDLPLGVLTERWAYLLGKDPPLPQLVPIRVGSFMEGSDLTAQEQPMHLVTIAQPFSLSRTEVTFSEWDACVAHGDCNSYHPDDEGWGRGTQPVINVSWEDTRAYVAWLSQKTGKSCRLPSEAEWEYAARAGTKTEYALPSPNGSDDIQGIANCADCGSKWEQAAPVGQFPPNSWGLYDMHGNVFEWVEDCWHGSYVGAPTDGQAWLEGNDGNCPSKVVRGGSWNYYKDSARAASRLGSSPHYRSREFGFRVVCSFSVSQILVVLKTSKNPYFKAMGRAVENVTSSQPQYQVTVKYGSETTLDETNTGRGQLQAIRSFIEQKPPGQSYRSAVSLAPASSSPEELAELGQLISDLNTKHIPVIILDTKIPKDILTTHTAFINAFIGSDNETGGQLAAHFIGKKIGNKKVPVLFLEGAPDQETAQARKRGFLKVFKAQYPNWIITEKIAQWDRNNARDITKDILDTTGIPPAAIFGSNDQMALGAIEALDHHHVARDQWPIIVGFDATKEALDMIHESRLSATIGQKPEEMSRTAVKWSVDLINSRQVPNEMLLPVDVISE